MTLESGVRLGRCEIAYLSSAEFREAAKLDQDRLLAVLRFGPSGSNLQVPCPVVSVPLENLTDQDTVEVWRSHSPVRSGEEGRIRYATNGTVTFGTLSFEETDSSNLAAQTRGAYRELLEFVKRQKCPHLLRIWNFLGEINQEQDNLERYRSFCKGRYEAFEAFDPDFEPTLAAATAVGSRQTGVLIYFLTAAEPGIALANPRQINAWAYPKQYGPRGPSFSRATLKEWNGQHQLYVAGTSSIVGHKTVHEGNIRKQLQETLSNIKALQERAEEIEGVKFSGVDLQSIWKVFLRHREDFSLVEEYLNHELETHAPIMYLQADICRADLLVEIEAVFTT